MNKLPSITIGIPTYYGGSSLVRAVKSVTANKKFAEFRLIVAVDGNPLDKKIEKSLIDLGAEVVLAKKRGGQVARINQIIKMTRSKLLILTQDDVTWQKNTLESIVSAFEKDPELTMVGTKVIPTKAETWLEKILEAGVYGNLEVGKMWRNGDNYLLASGRCLAFTTRAIKKFKLPVEVINSDAFMYLENKRVGGKFKFVEDAVVFNKSPQKLSEYIKQQGKFVVSKLEMKKYFTGKIEGEYEVPGLTRLKALIKLLVSSPIVTTEYLVLQTYSQPKSKDLFINQTQFWETDKSTKR